MSITSGILKRCLEECDKSKHEFKIGAVIFKGKKIISSGHNRIRSSSINNRYKTYLNALHAEQAALLQVDWNNVKNCSILVVRTTRTGVLSNAMPCEMCTKILQYVGIKNIWYSIKGGSIIHEKW